MANEVIKKTERFILVVVNSENEERPLYQDYLGNFVATEPQNIAMAKSFEDEDNAGKIRDTLNILYQLTNRPATVKLVKETTERVVIQEKSNQ